MSKSIVNQNFKLLETLQPNINFLRKLKSDEVMEVAAKAHLIVFNRGMPLAREQELNDFVGIVLEGKVIAGGKNHTTNYTIGYLSLLNLLQKHVDNVNGDSEGILLAFRLDEISKLSESCRYKIIEYCMSQALNHLKEKNTEADEWEQVSEKSLLKYIPKDFQEVFDLHIDPKQKAIFSKYFPFKKFKHKDVIIDQQSSSYLLLVIKGELIVKKQRKIILKNGDFYNTEGFLLEYTNHSNIYCLSQEAVVLVIDRSLFLKHLKSQTFFRLCSYLLRKQINEKKYQIETYEKKRQKNNLDKKEKDLSPFFKASYEILPLNFPPSKGVQIQEDKKNNGKKNEKMLGILFKNHLDDKKKLKTASTSNSKLERLISLKTEKNEQQKIGGEKELALLKKDMESLQLKLKFYEDNYKKIKLELIEYKSRYLMVPVLKQIVNYSQSKKKSSSLPESTSAVTLKEAFYSHLKANRIQQIVARCAYKWLWIVRRKKKGFGSSKFKAN